MGELIGSGVLLVVILLIFMGKIRPIRNHRSLQKSDASAMFVMDKPVDLEPDYGPKSSTAGFIRWMDDQLAEYEPEQAPDYSQFLSINDSREIGK